MGCKVGSTFQARHWEWPCADEARGRAAGFELQVWYLGQVTGFSFLPSRVEIMLPDLGSLEGC